MNTIRHYHMSLTLFKHKIVCGFFKKENTRKDLLIGKRMQFYIIHVLVYTLKYNFFNVRMSFQHLWCGGFIGPCTLLSFIKKDILEKIALCLK